MAVQTKYITSLLSVFSTFLETLNVSRDLALLTIEKFIVFTTTRKEVDKNWTENWQISELEKFITAQNVPHKSAVLMRKFITNYTPFEVDIYLHEFLTSLKISNRSDSTIKNYRSDIQQFTTFVGVKKLEHLFDPQNLRAFVQNQLKSGLQVSTIKRKLSSISQFALWAESEKIITDASFWISDMENLVSGKPGNYPYNTKTQTHFASENSSKTAEKELADYLISLEIDSHSDSTIKNYKSDIGQFLEFSRQPDLQKLITSEEIKNFVVAQKKLGLKISSIKRKVTSISQFALWAEGRGALQGVSYWIHHFPNQLFETEKVDSARTVPDQKPLVTQENSTNQQKFELKIKPTTLLHAYDTKPQNQGWSLPVQDFTSSEIKEEKQAIKSEKLSPPKGYTLALFHSLKKLQNFTEEVSNDVKNKQLLPYINLGILIFVIIGFGFLGYQQFVQQAPTSLAFPTSPVRPDRKLSFQGRLTDTTQNPITSATNMAFRLYDTGPGAGGTQLWSSGTCSVTPDQDGIFNVGLGDDCGSEITQDVFSENSNVWLEVQIVSETLTPRQSIKTVAYALNSETVQGYPISATGAATTNTILTMGSGGEVLLGEVSPRIKSNSGTFSLEAQTLSLETSSGSNGNIILNPDGTGKVIVQSNLDLEGYLYAPGATFSATYAGGKALVTRGGPSGTANIQEWQNSAGTVLSSVDESGNIGIGTSNPQGAFDISKDDGNALLDIYFNNTNSSSGGQVLHFQGQGTDKGTIQLANGTNALFSYSSDEHQFNVSTSERVFYLDAGGNAPNRVFVGAADTTTPASFNVLGFTGNSELPLVRFEHESTPTLDYLQVATNGSATGDIFAINSNGNVGIGSATPGYTLDLVGEFNLTDAIRVVGNAGTSGYLLTSSGGGANTWTDPASLAGTNWWANTLNVFHPRDQYANVADLAIGGTATASADIQLFSNGAATFNEQSNSVDFRVESNGDTHALFIQGSTNNVGIGTNTPGAKLQVTGDIFPSVDDAYDLGSSSLRWQDLYLGSASMHIGTNGNEAIIGYNTAGNYISLDPDGDADADISIVDAGYLGIGTTAPIHALETNRAVTGKALVLLKETGDQDILTASNSAGTTRFRMAHTGYMYSERFADISNESYYLDPAGSTTSMTVVSNVGIGTTNPISKLNVGGDMYIQTTATVGNSFRGIQVKPGNYDENQYIRGWNHSGSLNLVTGSTATGNDSTGITIHPINGILLSTNSLGSTAIERVRINADGNVGIGSATPGYTLDLVGEFNLTDAIRVVGNAGTSGYLLTSSGGGANTWTDPASLAGTNWWANTLNVFHPRDQYANVADLAIGGTATASADIQLFSNGAATFNEQSNSVDFRVESNGDTHALFIQGSTNNVGIGTSSPAQKLQITGSAPVVRIDNSDTSITAAQEFGKVEFQQNDTEVSGIAGSLRYVAETGIGGTNSFDTGFILATTLNGTLTDRFYVNSEGNVGIGTATIPRTLTVAGGARITTSTAVTDTLTLCTDANGDIEFKSGACTVSSLKYKQNVESLSYGLDSIREMNPVFFEYKDFVGNDLSGRTKRKVGFIAEEMQLVVPEVVIYQDGEIDGIDYAFLTSVLTKGIQELDAKVESIFTNLVASTASITDLTVQSLQIGGKTIEDYIVSIINNQNADNSGELASPIAGELTVDSLITDSITATGSSILGSLLVEDTVITNNITVQGDATVSGSLLASLIKSDVVVTQNATVAGILQAGTLTANQIEAASSRIALLETGMAQLDSVRATTAELVTATVSGTLYADNIYDFENKVATTLQQPGLLDILLGTDESTASAGFMQDLYDTVNKSEFNASSSADLDLSFSELSMTSDDVAITGSALFVEKYFKVNGAGYISDSLAVGNTLFVGETMQIADGLVRYTAADPTNQILKIQPEGQGSVELLAGIVTIDDSGKVTVNGDLEVTGNAKIAGTLLTNMLKPGDFGNPFQVQVAGVDTQTNEVKKSRFEIINEVGTPVATFSAEGNAAFAGKVNIEGGIGIASQDLGSNETNELTATKTSGKATIKSGANEVTIKSSLMKNESLVYVTAVGSTGNQVIYVKSQAIDDPNTPDQEGRFVVGFDSPTTTDVSFNWWIVN